MIGSGELSIWLDSGGIDEIVGEIYDCQENCDAENCDDCSLWGTLTGVAETIADLARDYMETLAREWVDSHSE